MADDTVNRLLHDAERADAGADFARMLRDAMMAAKLTAKRNRLVARAHKLDPRHADEAWQETTLPPSALPRQEARDA